MCRQPPPGERSPELGAQEGAGGVAGDAVVPALTQPLHHGGPGVVQIAPELETFVVDDRMHAPADRRAECIDARFHLVDVRLRTDLEALEVDEQGVLGRVVAQACSQWQLQQAAAQAHRCIGKKRGLHRPHRVHDGREGHAVQDVALQVDAGRHLDQLQAFGAQLEDAAFGDVEHLLVALDGLGARKAAVLHLADELACGAVAHHAQPPLLQAHIGHAGAEAAQEHHLASALADVDEAAGTREPSAELRDIDVALRIGLRQAEKGDVESAPVVEVELVGLVDHRLGIDGGAEVQAPGRHAADDTRLGGQRHQVGDLLFGSDRGYAFWHADAEVDHAVGAQFERCTARDDLAQAEFKTAALIGRHAQFAGIGRAVGRGKGLRVQARFGQHHAIDQRPGDLHLAWVQAAALGQPLDLHDDQAAAVARRHGDGQALQRECLALHGDVAVGVGRGATHDGHVDGQRAVEQVLAPLQRQQRHQVVARALVELAATVARIDKRAQADAAQVAGPASGDVAEQVRNHALRQVVGLDAVVHRQFLQPRHQPPMATNGAANQAFMSQVVEPAVLAIALPCGIQQGQLARAPGVAGQEQILQRAGHRLGKADADEAAGGHRIAAADQAHGLLGGDELVAADEAA